MHNKKRVKYDDLSSLQLLEHKTFILINKSLLFVQIKNKGKYCISLINKNNKSTHYTMFYINIINSVTYLS